MIQANRISLILIMKIILGEQGTVRSTMPYKIYIIHDIIELKLLLSRYLDQGKEIKHIWRYEQILQNFILKRETRHSAMWPSFFEVFLILLDSRRSWALSRLVTCRQSLSYYIQKNIRFTCGISNLNQKLSKYYGQHCRL